MKLIKTEEAVGHVLCHDMTQIIRGVSKGPRFRKGQIVKEEDIPVLLSMGKEHLYVYEMKEGVLHENEAADRLAALCGTEGFCWRVREGQHFCHSLTLQHNPQRVHCSSGYVS